MHGNQSLPYKRKDGKLPYQCNLCPQTCDKLSHFKDHILTHTGKRPVKCHVCDKSFHHNSNQTSRGIFASTRERNRLLATYVRSGSTGQTSSSCTSKGSTPTSGPTSAAVARRSTPADCANPGRRATASRTASKSRSHLPIRTACKY